MNATVMDAARRATSHEELRPEQFAQIYYEHPYCVGGPETHKLFLPYGLKSLLLGTVPPGFSGYPDVLESALQAGFWFWPEPLITCLRPLASRLFIDWFENGQYGLEDWPNEKIPGDDLTGPGDDIMRLCSFALIDPKDCVEAIAGLGTPWADDALTLSFYGNTVHAPFYCSPDTGLDSTEYKDACELIAAALSKREAVTVFDLITPDCLEKAFFRNADSHPTLAADLSKLLHNYEVESVRRSGDLKGEIDIDWPTLPIVD